MLIGLPGLLREFEAYRLLVYGGALVASPVLRPQEELEVPTFGGAAELHEEVEQDAWAAGTTGDREAVAAVLRAGASAPGRRTSSEPNGTRLLELGNVAKHFGGLYALSGLDLHVDEGEIVSVIGPNGAGKSSTMFNVVTGLYPPDDSDVRFRGESIVGLAAAASTRSSGWRGHFQTVHLFSRT